MVLPPDIHASEKENAALGIKAHLLRAKLEMSQEEAEAPLSLLQLLSLLTELASHVADMEDSLAPVWPAWRQFSHASKLLGEPSKGRAALLGDMRASVLGIGPLPLRTVLARQRNVVKFCLVLQSALKSASVQFARELAAEFDPAAITAAARKAKPQARAEDFWKHYERQADRMTPSEIEQRLTRRLVAAIEELFLLSAAGES